MKKVEGKEVWEFEAHESRQKEQFELLLTCDTCVDRLVEALMTVMTQASRKRNEAWRSMAEKLGVCHSNLSYDWVTGQISIKEEE